MRRRRATRKQMAWRKKFAKLYGGRRRKGHKGRRRSRRR